MPPGAALVPAGTTGGLPRPAGAQVLFFELRARMHGLVMLDLLGHLHPLQEHGALVFETAMRRMSDELDSLRAHLPPEAG